MLDVPKISALVLGLALAASVPAVAIDVVAPPMTVKAGTTVRLYGVFDCVHNIAPATSAMVDHGKITMKVGTINRCGNPKQPISELYYTPDLGYRGPDEAKIFRGSDYTLRKIKVQ